MYRGMLVLGLLCLVFGESFGQVNLPVVIPPSISYQTPQVYNVNTAITPLSPTNTAGTVPANPYGQVSTFAGDGTAGSTNATGTAASFHAPHALAVDAAGSFYVAEYPNKIIRKITSAGVVTTFAGILNTPGTTDGPVAIATFNGPTSVVFNSGGNMFVADYLANTIREISTTGIVSTFAGSGTAGYLNATGTAAMFNQPYGLAIDANDNIYVADQQNDAIRKITPAGVVTTLAGGGPGNIQGPVNGTGATALFTLPGYVAVDAAGNVYVGDGGDNDIRKITPVGVVTTIAGILAPQNVNSIGVPGGLRVDKAGNIYFAVINSNKIMELTAGGVLKTIAGLGTAGATNGFGNAASFNQPQDVEFDADGNLLVADQNNNLIRKVNITGYTISQLPPAGMSFDASTGIISGTPTVTSPPTDYTVTAYNASGSSSTIVRISVVTVNALPPAVINFPIPTNNQVGTDGILVTNATSNNTEVPITYTSNNPAVAYIGTDGKVHVIAPGVVTITALQAASANFGAAVPVSRSYTITGNQAIDFPAIGTKTTCSAGFSASASAHNFGFPLSGIPITYASSNPAVATVNSATGQISILTVGNTIITASQAGNTLYDPATPVSQTLTVTAPILPTFSITINGTPCIGALLSFKAVLSNNVTLVNPHYQWQINNNNTGTNSDTFSAVLSSTDVLKCIIVNNDQCVTTNTVNLPTLNLLPLNTLAVNIQSSATGPACKNTPIIFTATPNIGGTNTIYQWLVNGVNVGINSATFSSSTLNNGDVVICSYTNNSAACFTNRTVTSAPLTVNIASPLSPSPAVSINASANNVYAGVPIIFTATPLNATASIKYQWQVNDVNSGSNSATFTTIALSNGDKITCTIITGTSCDAPVTSAPLTAIILPPLVITPPNTFTPNGDGINDQWVINGLLSYPNCLVTVYSRYGTTVFQSKGYTKPWDGLYKGSNLPVGTYYYVIDLDINKPRISGYLTILR